MNSGDGSVTMRVQILRARVGAGPQQRLALCFCRNAAARFLACFAASHSSAWPSQVVRAATSSCSAVFSPLWNFNMSACRRLHILHMLWFLWCREGARVSCVEGALRTSTSGSLARGFTHVLHPRSLQCSNAIFSSTYRQNATNEVSAAAFDWCFWNSAHSLGFPSASSDVGR